MGYTRGKGSPWEAVAASGCILSIKTLMAQVKAAQDSPPCRPPTRGIHNFNPSKLKITPSFPFADFLKCSNRFFKPLETKSQSNTLTRIQPISALHLCCKLLPIVSKL